ncbi:MAG: hypothetical protein KME26_15640 [Oscillatoria princeps RMCB-10]|nr:hypothetical protein [Oscillatoria princeps RMCB-10]
MPQPKLMPPLPGGDGQHLPCGRCAGVHSFLRLASFWTEPDGEVPSADLRWGIPLLSRELGGSRSAVPMARREATAAVSRRGDRIGGRGREPDQLVRL